MIAISLLIIGYVAIAIVVHGVGVAFEQHEEWPDEMPWFMACLFWPLTAVYAIVLHGGGVVLLAIDHGVMIISRAITKTTLNIKNRKSKMPTAKVVLR